MEYRTDTKKDDYHGQVLIAEEDESTLIYEKDLRDENPASSYVESEDEDQERALL